MGQMGKIWTPPGSHHCQLMCVQLYGFGLMGKIWALHGYDIRANYYNVGEHGLGLIAKRMALPWFHQGHGLKLEYYRLGLM